MVARREDEGELLYGVCSEIGVGRRVRQSTRGASGEGIG